ncbi:MAG TPA: class I SAM-dependent RNA methyltransferase [Burkholderiales bacterium]|jgi:putative N6-adenine-specific DNA methylase|nr:class I SAM-dependent RNA methyltransferase [Burkholderiales bacterium]
MNRTVTEKFFAPCPRGLEGILADELAGLGAAGIAAAEGGVGFAGDLSVAYAANLHSRIASRVLWQIGAGRYRNEDDVYRGVHGLDWKGLFDPRRTIRVNVASVGSPLRSLEFITLRIKDAACDKFRAQTSVRPSVDTAAPDVRIHAFLEPDRYTLYLDTSGEPLFKRGARQVAGEAPLRENLAAGLIRLSGWTPDRPFLDPMCGSGTLLIEAIGMARRIPPGQAREFAFAKLHSYDPAAWQRVTAQASAAMRPDEPLRIHGSDLYGDAVKLARTNLEAAGFGGVANLKQANLLEISAPAEGGVLLTNPPYGVRLGEQDELAAFYPRLGDVLKKKFAGWDAYVFTADLRLPRLIGLKPSKRTPLYNGPLECRLYEFRMVSGAMRREKREEREE